MGNRLLLFGILIQILFSWALLYVAPLQKVLGTGPVSRQIYALAWFRIPLIFGLDYMRKRLMGVGTCGRPSVGLRETASPV